MEATENRFALILANRAGFATVADHVAAKRAAHAAEIERERAVRFAARVVKANSFYLCRANDGLASDGWFTETVDGMASARASGHGLDGVVAFFRAANGRITRSL
jgi:hypothetical protein